MLVLLPLAAIYLFYLVFHAKRLYVVRGDDQQCYSVVARHPKWTRLTEAGLPRESLKLGVWPWDLRSVYFLSPELGRSRVALGKSVYTCETDEGVDVSVELHSRPPIPEAPPPGPEPDPDVIFKKKEW